MNQTDPRPKTVMVRLTDEEYADLKAAANLVRQKLGPYAAHAAVTKAKDDLSLARQALR